MGLVQSKISSAFSNRAPEEVVQHLPVFYKEHVFGAIRTGDANRLFSLIDEGKVDLTAINEETGGTALHLAISEKNDDILKMLLDMAGDDPEVLDAKDRNGCTPLMCAAVELNVPMMKALVEVGAGVDNHFPTRSQLPRNATQSMIIIASCTTAARILMSAKGDLLTAFEIAAEKRKDLAKSLFFEGGADSASALQHFVSQKKWSAVESIIKQWKNRQTRSELRHFVTHKKRPAAELTFQQWKNRRTELTTVLDDAVKLEDSEAISKLVKWDPCGAASDLLVRYVLSNDTKGVSALLNASSDAKDLVSFLRLKTSLITIAEKENLSDAEKIAAIKMIINPVGCDAAVMRDVMAGDLLANAFFDKKLNAVRLMVAAGVPANPEQLVKLLMYLGENNQLADIRAVIRSGANIFTAIKRVSELCESDAKVGNDDAARLKQDAVNNLVMMLVDEAPFRTKLVYIPEPQPKAESYCVIS